MSAKEPRRAPAEQGERIFRATIRLPGGIVVEVEAPDAEGLEKVVAGIATSGPDSRRTAPRRAPRQGAPQRPSDAELEAAWNEAVDAGQSARQVLSARYGASERTISKWAAEARIAGRELRVVFGTPRASRSRPRATD